jgi:multiple sugar transport system permease protein
LTKGENLFGWLFVSPALTILLLFLVIPIILALYVSFTNWSGLTNPLSSSVKWVGLANYRTLITQPGLDQTNFGTAVRDNFYFVSYEPRVSSGRRSTSRPLPVLSPSLWCSSSCSRARGS